MDPLRNPFNPGAGTPPPALLGRDELLEQFNITLLRARSGKPGQSLMPVGLRGVGKTVLLNRFAEQAAALSLRYAFVELPENADLRALIAKEIRKLLLDLDRAGAVSQAVKRALRALKGFTVAASAESGISFTLNIDPEAGLADSGSLAEDLTDLFVTMGEAAKDRDTAVLLALDELQYLSEDAFAALISAIHRTTQLQLPVVLVGAGLPQLPALAGNAKSYAERLFRFPQIGALSQTEAREALRKPVDDQGVAFEGAAIEEIVSLTKGYPYFLQEWGYAVWNLASSSPITIGDVRMAGEVVIRKLDESFFRVRFDRLTPMEKKYLRAMAELGPGPHRSGDIAAKYGAKVESVAPMRGQLIRKGMVFSPSHGNTAFTVPLFDEFLRRALQWPINPGDLS